MWTYIKCSSKLTISVLCSVLPEPELYIHLISALPVTPWPSLPVDEGGVRPARWRKEAACAFLLPVLLRIPLVRAFHCSSARWASILPPSPALPSERGCSSMAYYSQTSSASEPHTPRVFMVVTSFCNSCLFSVTVFSVFSYLLNLCLHWNTLEMVGILLFSWLNADWYRNYGIWRNNDGLFALPESGKHRKNLTLDPVCFELYTHCFPNKAFSKVGPSLAAAHTPLFKQSHWSLQRISHQPRLTPSSFVAKHILKNILELEAGSQSRLD